MKATQIVKGISWVGVQNPDLRIFDVIMHTQWGTSYNSYLVQGSEKTMLVDTVKQGFTDEFIDRISSVCDISKIDYIVCNHTEPDHSGSLGRLLELAPNAVVACSKPASVFLRNILNTKFECMVVGDGDTIDLGGKTVKFISAPFLHWPDSIFTYIVEDAVLLSGDVFGFHFSAKNIFDDLTDLTDDMIVSQEYYFDVIMAPFSNYVIDAVKKTRGLHIDVIGPSHGPVLRAAPWDAVDRYEKWANEVLAKNEVKKVFIGYVTCYGYTKMLADEIAMVVGDAGFEVQMQDVSLIDQDESAAMIHKADAFALGSPTLNRDVLKPVWDVMTSVSTYLIKGKPAVAFGSFGWSGESVKYMAERLRNVGADVVGTCSAKLMPDENELEEARKAGKALVEALSK